MEKYNVIKQNFKNIRQIHHMTLPNDLNLVIAPMKGFTGFYGMTAINYGSIDTSFVTEGVDHNSPQGIAHFLEHKLFDEQQGNVMDKFSELGSFPNAFTSFDMTAYLFSCTDKFYDNLSLLLNFVQDLSINDESVQREKSIIGQEIDMFMDNPKWRGLINTLEGLYPHTRATLDIAGSRESISLIDCEQLYKCYDSFYIPNNMTVCVAGDIDIDRCQDLVYKETQDMKKGILPGIILDKPDEIKGPIIVEKEMETPRPYFLIGFRDDKGMKNGIESVQRELACEILMEALFSKAGRVYDRLYRENLMLTPISYEYNFTRAWTYAAIGGDSDDPKEVFKVVVDELKKGISDEEFERAKRSVYGNLVEILDSNKQISKQSAFLYFRGTNLFDYIKVCGKIKKEQIQQVLDEIFSAERSVLSIINPQRR